MTVTFSDSTLTVVLGPGDTLRLETQDSLVGEVAIDEYRKGGVFFTPEGQEQSTYLGGGKEG